MRMPSVAIPSDVLVEELEDSPTRRYRYRFIANATADVDAVLHALKQGNQMFATRIVEENPWYKPIIAPHGKSFFFRLVWTAVALLGVFIVLTTVAIILANEELSQQLMESFRLFTEG
jgi:hypothetical protein